MSPAYVCWIFCLHYRTVEMRWPSLYTVCLAQVLCVCVRVSECVCVPLSHTCCRDSTLEQLVVGLGSMLCWGFWICPPGWEAPHSLGWHSAGEWTPPTTDNKLKTQECKHLLYEALLWVHSWVFLYKTNAQHSERAMTTFGLNQIIALVVSCGCRCHKAPTEPE